MNLHFDAPEPKCSCTAAAHLCTARADCAILALTVNDSLYLVWQPPYVDLFVGQHGVYHAQDDGLVDALEKKQRLCDDGVM